MQDEVFINPSRRAIRILLMIAGVFVVIGIAPGAVYLVLGSHAPGGLKATSAIVGLIMAPMAVAMLLSALLTIGSARASDRAFAAFRAGDLLARWEYPADFWAAYIATAVRQGHRNALIVLALVFGPTLLLGVFIGYSVPDEPAAKLAVAGLVLIAVGILTGLSYALARRLLSRRRTRLADCPRAYIGPTAIYCGGVFNFWGSQMRGLKSVTLAPPTKNGDAECLVFVIGLSKRAQNFARAADTINLVTLHPTFASQYTTRQEIPITPEQAAQARELLARFQPPDGAPSCVHLPD
jgi:hypothetical protein